jgi:hypothetical protein
MVILKPEIKRNNNTQTLTKREQMIISKVKMGYTRFTHGHRVDLESPPECGDCGCRLSARPSRGKEPNLTHRLRHSLEV